MKKNTNFDRIEAYLFEHMQPEERLDFEKEMAENSELAAEVEKQRLEIRAMELLAEQELRMNFAEWKVEKAEQDAQGGARIVAMSNTRRMIFRIAVAASVLLLIGFFAQRLLMGPDQQQMALNRFEESATSARVRGSADIPAALQPALDEMASGRYREALSALQSLEAQNAKTTLLQGECYFRMKNYEQAVQQFSAVIQTGEPAEKEEAEYLLLLTYVASGKYPDEARSLRARILQDSGHGYYEQARSLVVE